MRTVNPGVVRAIEAVSPRNPYGAAIYRVVWSQDRLEWRSGWWNDYDSATGALLGRKFESRKVPKYQFAPRWVMEKWMPPEFFGTPEMWDQATREWSQQQGVVYELGPYPSEGDYVYIWKCETPDGKYLEISPTMAQYTIDLDQMPPPTTAQLKEHQAARQAAEDHRMTSLITDLMGDPFPFLGRVSNLNPRPLLDKIREQKRRGKEI